MENRTILSCRSSGLASLGGDGILRTTDHVLGGGAGPDVRAAADGAVDMFGALHGNRGGGAREGGGCGGDGGGESFGRCDLAVG